MNVGLIGAIDWQASGTIVSMVVASASLVLSLLNHIRSARKLKISVDVSEWTKYREPQLRIAVAHDGNHPLSVRKIVLTSERFDASKSVFDSTSANAETPLQPGQIRTYTSHGSGYLLFDRATVTLHDGSHATVPLRHDVDQVLRWYCFLAPRLQVLGYGALKAPMHLLGVKDGQGTEFTIDVLKPFYADGDNHSILDGKPLVTGVLADLLTEWSKKLPHLFVVSKEGKKLAASWTEDAMYAAYDQDSLNEFEEAVLAAEQDETMRLLAAPDREGTMPSMAQA